MTVEWLIRELQRFEGNKIVFVPGYADTAWEEIDRVKPILVDGEDAIGIR